MEKKVSHKKAIALDKIQGEAPAEVWEKELNVR